MARHAAVAVYARRMTSRPLLIGATLLFSAGCGPEVGDACTEEEQGETQCVGSDLMQCDEGEWARDDLCSCELSGQVQCAIPGFVGVTRARDARPPFMPPT